MRAVQMVGPRRLEMLELPPPELQDGEVLVRLHYLSVCGSDTHAFRQIAPAERYPFSVGYSGHECTGIVEESRCEAFRRGDRVLPLPLQNRGLAEYVAVPCSRVVPLPDDGDLSTWTLCQPLGTVLYACNRLGSVVGKRVAVVGQGPIGLCFSYLLSRMGAAEVIGIDPLDYRLAHARRLGATQTLNPTTDSVTEAMADLTKGQGADIVVEAVGRESAVQQAIQLARFQGVVALFGVLPAEPFPVDMLTVLRRMLTILPSMSSTSPDPAAPVREAVQLVHQGRVDLSSLLTHRTTFDQVQWTYETYEAQADNCLKIVMQL